MPNNDSTSILHHIWLNNDNKFSNSKSIHNYQPYFFLSIHSTQTPSLTPHLNIIENITRQLQGNHKMCISHKVCQSHIPGGQHFPNINQKRIMKHNSITGYRLYLTCGRRHIRHKIMVHEKEITISENTWERMYNMTWKVKAFISV